VAEVIREEWRAFFDGTYEVSNLGQVRRAAAGRRTHTGRLLKPTLLRIGYYKVSPVLNGKNRQLYIHRLVAEAFLGSCPDGAEVNHIDGDKTNNRLDNLEYVSHLGNMRHARRLDLLIRGERHGQSKLSDEQAQQIRDARAAGESGASVARRFGIAQSTVSQIYTGKRRAS
jgi:hypothetical protein